MVSNRTAVTWCRRLAVVVGLVAMQAEAQTSIEWNSTFGKNNLTSSGSLLDGGFRFELGVFTPPFVPTAANIADWASHWNAAGRTGYNVSKQRYAAICEVADNEGPFTAGAKAYVWGFRGDAAASEWILFRADGWTWPVGSPIGAPSPTLSPWIAKDAKAVLGKILTDGTMQTAAVANAAPPATIWTQWQAEALADEALDQPNDDADGDGVPNVLEYAFGTAPKAAGVRAATAMAVVDGHVQITIPRRIDHPARWQVEMSDDLTQWGPVATQVVSNGLSALVLREIAPLGTGHPRRFWRVRAEVDTP